MVQLYSPDELMSEPEKAVMSILKKEWGFAENEEISVVGNIREVVTTDEKRLYFLENLRHPKTFRKLSYPLAGQPTDTTVFVPPKEVSKDSSKGFKDVYYVCSVFLSDFEHRSKHGNPFELTAHYGTVSRMESIPVYISDVSIKDKKEKRLLVDSQVIEYFKSQASSDIDAARESAVKKLEKEIADLEAEQERSRDKLSSYSNDMAELLENIESRQISLDKINQDVAFGENEIRRLEEYHSERVRVMSDQLHALSDLIKEKGEKLVKLNLLDESDLNAMLGNFTSEREPGYSFHGDLGGDYGLAASYIQAFLRNKNIYYSKAQIKNFWALLRTNDLIVLAGDSGSGKTSLVKSFANAIGGVAKVIPVKPNWTSSEDLLGYYNPIEKKYLSTEFLDALMEARQNPSVPYLICLDEMNLARVEYYFADFLSKLEERDNEPVIHLYSSSELSDTLADYKTFLSLVEEVQNAQSDKDLEEFVSILKDDVANVSLHKICGFHEGDSLLRYHSYIRKQARGIINTPTEITMPKNVRIIGAVNVDETTHYLSPKILDRAHVVKFSSPLLNDWSSIESEIMDFSDLDLSRPLNLDINDLGEREQYPAFSLQDTITARLVSLSKEYFLKLGLDFGLRTVRQARYYEQQLAIFGESDNLALNNILLQKAFPKMTFDGSKSVGDVTKLEILHSLLEIIEETVDRNDIPAGSFSAIKELAELITRAEANDSIVNYWS
ncbi:AAA family ATPase [uncultured Halomonas sp.]|uniref:McrB family protein n=1 Tax=uncultured Halomonas sp. TaxID=173971 RepID=UPI00262C2A4D|nr:AAA family ATPase [uncultured Halomonas sp.]